MTVPGVYPLVFEPLLKTKVWGGRRLEAYGKTLPAEADVGESWEIADLASTDPSGGGGDEARSVIANGELRGTTLHAAMGLWGDALLGDSVPARDGEFPLLVKFLDAREHLSVQVHPSPEYAATHAEAHLKTEAWYVLEAEPGAVIFKGVREGVDREALERSVRDGELVDRIRAVPARPGDCHCLPSGTLHALGAGVLVAEVQTPSDTTFRVYDWAREYGRVGRPLHIDQALDCIDFGPAPASTRMSPDDNAARLVDTRFFDLWEMRAPGASKTLALPEAGGCVVLMALNGSFSLEARDGSFAEAEARRGTTALVPAASRAATRIRPIGPVTVLAVTLD